MKSVRGALVWAGVSGLLLSQAYLVSGLFALPGVITMGLALRAARASARPRGLSVLVGALAQGLIGVCCWGFAHYGWGLYAATVAYMAVSGALFGLLLAGRSNVPLSSWRVGLAWTAIEVAHTLGPIGFPLFLGGSQAHLPWRSALGVVGAAGVSGLLIAWGFAVSGLATSHREDRRWHRALRVSAIVVAVTLFGRWQPGLADAGPQQSVAVIQGGLPNWMYDAAARSATGRALVEAAYTEPTRANLEDGADLVVLPEAAFHRPLITRDGRVLSETLPPVDADGVVVMGTYRTPLDDGGEPREFNAIAVLPARRPDTVVAFVDKALRVPLVETGFSGGAPARALSWPGGPVTLGALVCYESMYPALAVSAALGGVLVVATNDAGFQEAPVSRAHLHQGWARAVEVGRPLVRAAQAGESLVVDEYGRPSARSATFEAAVLHARVTPVSGRTWYVWFGRWLVTATLVIAPLVLAWSLASRPRDAHHGSAPATPVSSS